MRPNTILNVSVIVCGTGVLFALVAAGIQLSQRHEPVDFSHPAQKEPTTFVMTGNHSTDFYALGTRCDEKTGLDCRVWRIAEVGNKRSIKYDRDSGELSRCGPIDVVRDDLLPTDCVVVK